ncbi:hypothetical protein B0H14DRAFT_2786362 [Mycena olivaceomarginata]|nr:hypothetical protein B0H14DRAFT_2786362 [Mycena olivaceomarginata]
MPGGVWGAARLPHPHVFACLGSRFLFLLSFFHPSFSPPPRDSAISTSPPLRLRLRVCGAAHVGAGASSGCGHALCSLQRCYCTRGYRWRCVAFLGPGGAVPIARARCGGGGVGLDADTKEVLEANSDTEKGAPPQTGTTRVG